jgi:hypothetical protein
MFEYSNNEKTPRNGWVLRWNGSLKIPRELQTGAAINKTDLLLRNDETST